MTYRVIVNFKDLQDERYQYYPGDIFPREGMEVSEERLEELSSCNNIRGIPVITIVEEAKPKTKKRQKKEENVD